MVEEIDRARRDQAFKMIGQLVDGVISEACLRHYYADTQEHQLTAKIAAEIEREIRNVSVDGLSLSLHMQDFSDKGRGSKERKSGSDLYVSIVLSTPDVTFSKGILAQSKWDHALPRAKKDLQEQSHKMMSRTNAAYVWIYGPAGIVAIPASDVRDGQVDYSNAQTVGQLIADSLRCEQ
jgi:hypothetical protein